MVTMVWSGPWPSWIRECSWRESRARLRDLPTPLLLLLLHSDTNHRKQQTVDPVIFSPQTRYVSGKLVKMLRKFKHFHLKSTTALHWSNIAWLQDFLSAAPQLPVTIFHTILHVSLRGYDFTFSVPGVSQQKKLSFFWMTIWIFSSLNTTNQLRQEISMFTMHY